MLYTILSFQPKKKKKRCFHVCGEKGKGDLGCRSRLEVARVGG